MTALRPDLAVIAANVAPGSRVLDIGCGDGALMAALRDDDALRDARRGRSTPGTHMSATAVLVVDMRLYFGGAFPVQLSVRPVQI